MSEYLAAGVSYVWVLDPLSLAGEIYMSDGIERARHGIFVAGEIEVDVTQA